MTLDIIIYTGTTPVQRLSGSAGQVLANIDPAAVIREAPAGLADLSEAPAPAALPAITHAELVARTQS